MVRKKTLIITSAVVEEMAYIHTDDVHTTWKSFASSLPKSGGLRDEEADGVVTRTAATCETFVPAVQKNFSTFIIPTFAEEEVEGECIIQALEAFGELAESRGVAANKKGRRPRMQAVDFRDEIERAGVDMTCISTALIHIYTLEGFFYKEVNKALREDDAEVLEVLKLIFPPLLHGLSLPGVEFVGTVYRGFAIATQKEVDVYKTSLVFFWPGFTSCSKNQDESARFARGASGHPILFKIAIPSSKVACASSIQEMSKYPKEDEVLVAPYTSLTVNQTSLVEGMTLIECTAVSTMHNLTGIWSCTEDGGTYYLSQIGNKVVWFATGPSFGHVFFGILKNGELTGTFADLPTNEWRYDGAATFRISETHTRMQLKPEVSPDFFGRTFKRVKAHAEPADAPLLALCSVPADTGLTGEWRSDQGLVYFVRELSGKLFWFAYKPDGWSAANIFWGVQKGDEYIGIFSDLILSTRFRYAGEIAVQLVGTDLKIREVNGEYMCTSLTKVLR